MKKQYSLKSNIEFNKVINKGVKLKERHLLVAYTEANDFKLGISIPKKLGNAVFRNRNKRIIKSIIPTLDAYNINKHVVFIARDSFIKLTFEEKKKVLTNIIEQLNEK